VTRKLLVNVLAGAVVLLLGGAAFAQSGLLEADEAEPEEVPEVDPLPPEDDPDGIPLDEDPDLAHEPLAEPVDDPELTVLPGDDELDEDVTDLDPVEVPPADDTADEDGFGAIRSAEARAFGECMEEQGGGQEARAACDHLKPGPAHLNPAHPNHARKHGGAAPQEPAEDEVDAAADAGQAGPPAHAGKPAHAGPPAGAGKPAHAGPPAGAGKPAHAGPPAHAGGKGPKG
jgi:hypothetical protein